MYVSWFPLLGWLLFWFFSYMLALSLILSLCGWLFRCVGLGLSHKRFSSLFVWEHIGRLGFVFIIHFLNLIPVDFVDFELKGRFIAGYRQIILAQELFLFLFDAFEMARSGIVLRRLNWFAILRPEDWDGLLWTILTLILNLVDVLKVQIELHFIFKYRALQRFLNLWTLFSRIAFLILDILDVRSGATLIHYLRKFSYSYQVRWPVLFQSSSCSDSCIFLRVSSYCLRRVSLGT